MGIRTFACRFASLLPTSFCERICKLPDTTNNSQKASNLRNALISLSLSCLSSSIPVDTVRLSLESESAKWFRWLLRSSWILAAGCFLEIGEAWGAVAAWYRIQRKQDVQHVNAGSWHAPAAALGLLLVIVGVVGETVFESLASNADARIRTHESENLNAADEKASQAQLGAAFANRAAAEANERAKSSELELARYKAPIYNIPVKNGLAIPDLSNGYNQRVLLTSDTRIGIPLFARSSHSASFTWALFIDQDAVGKHVYHLDFVPDSGLYPSTAPNSRAILEFITESDGTTTLRGSGIINMPLIKAKTKK